MRVKWLRKALLSLDEAAEYIAKDHPEAARRLVAEAFRQTELLADHPEMGRPGRLSGTRELVMSGYPYLIPYRCPLRRRGNPARVSQRPPLAYVPLRLVHLYEE